MAEKRVTSDGVVLAVREFGEPQAPTIVLIHGYPDTGAVWDELVQRLQEQFHVVVYDVRGAGSSDVPDEESAYTLDKLTRDLAAVIDVVSPDRPVHLVGHDWGSVQAWEAVTDPAFARRIASFTSMSGPCLDHFGHWMRSRGRPRGGPRGWSQLAGQSARFWYSAVFQSPRAGEWLWRGGLARRWPAVLRRLEGVEPRPGHPAPTLARDAVAGMALYRANMKQRLSAPGERHTDVPIQLVLPTKDAYVSPAIFDDLEQWVSRLWRRRLIGGRHWAQRSHPDLLARWISEFVQHVDGAPGSREIRRAASARRGGDPFDEQLALITGAGSGIGRATARAFADLGAEVIVADIDPDAAARTIATIENAGGHGHAVEVDVSSTVAMEAFAAKVRGSYGVPDIVVNNAGIAVAGPLLDTGWDDWQRLLDINLWGVIHGARLFGQQMVERGEGGHIVNIASAAAYMPTSSLPAYCTAKSAVLMLSECLRAELAPAGVGVGAICPGFVNTPIARTARFVGVDDAEQQRLRQLGSRMLGRRRFPPEKVAMRVVRAVRDNKAVDPVNAEARVTYTLARWAPALARVVARAPLTR